MGILEVHADLCGLHYEEIEEEMEEEIHSAATEAKCEVDLNTTTQEEEEEEEEEEEVISKTRESTQRGMTSLLK